MYIMYNTYMKDVDIYTYMYVHTYVRVCFDIHTCMHTYTHVTYVYTQMNFKCNLDF